MNTLGKRNDQDEQVSKSFTIPAVVQNEPNEIPLEKALIISLLAHPAIVALIWLIVKGILLLLLILGITLPIFDKPQPKMRDIEFVLVNKKDEKPVNPNTKYRADRNSRAGGKHDPTKPVTEPEPMVSKSTPKQQAPAQKPAIQHKAVTKQTQQPKHEQQKEKTPVPPRPMPKPNVARPRIPIRSSFPIPVPMSKAPKHMAPEGGPVTSGPIGDSSPSSSPSPMMSSDSGSGYARGRQGSAYSPGGGSAGNPSPGNPNGRPGIDAIREPDFGPYMRELQRRIKRNWDPPRGNESKRVVLMFTVGRDGRLLGMKVQHSAGVPEADKAATSAVELTAPFRPLPPEYKGNSIDIQFTFDYNVFGVGGRRY